MSRGQAHRSGAGKWQAMRNRARAELIPRPRVQIQQAAIQPGSAKRPQQNDMIDKMDESSKQGPMVDRRFDRQLNQLYSEVVSEPLPKEFLELIDKLREKTPTK